MRFYTVHEVAKILKLKETSIREKLKKGEIEGFKFGKAWRVEEDVLNDYIKEKFKNNIVKDEKNDN